MRVVYVSYDGASEPLGRSQVVAYLTRIARSCDVTLISFEKDGPGRQETADLLQQAGIAWLPLSYHRKPPVLSTAWDVLAGARAVRRAIRSAEVDIVHVRSYVPALMALLAGPRSRRWRLLFDIRGFWADERGAGGERSRPSPIYRIVKSFESWFFKEADAVVTLTEASVSCIQGWARPDVPIRVIPTCVELERFGQSERRADGPRVVWCGSIGSIYRFDLAVRFADALGLPFVVLTRQVESARVQLGGRVADVREVASRDVGEELRPGDIGLCLYTDSFANLARAPTRFAEHLAAGMVVAVTPGIGDLDTIVAGNNVGVTIDDESSTGLARAAGEVMRLAADPSIRERARELASELYSVDDGANAYLSLYRELRS